MKILVSHEEIVEIAKKMGEEITKKYAGSELIMVCVLKGACPFHSELIKHINLDMLADYIQVKSYDGRETSGKIVIKKDLDYDISGKHVIVVEDIVDTGLTLSTLKQELEKRINVLSHFHDIEHVELSHDSEVEEIFKGADEKLFYKLNNYIDDE